MARDTTFLKRQGAHFLSLINDLKRNRQAAANDLGVSLDDVEQIISGEKDIEQALLNRAVEVWPVNRRDFMIVEDDAPQGVLVMRKERSKASSRIFSRGGSDYYEYCDTAMSKVAPFRPEWILELREVEDADPCSSQIQWNNGHFMHQFTMFIRAVNFYYIEDNERKVMEASTGDSMYITPFVPHTFATRQPDSNRIYGGEKGLILALTYGNQLVGDVQHELSALGENLSHQYVLNTSSREEYFSSLLKQQMGALSMTVESLIKQSLLSREVISDFFTAIRVPTAQEYRTLANVFNVNSRDLMPPDAFDKKVIVKHLSQTKPRHFSGYSVTDLASIRYLPFSKALILERDPLHQYCYNFGAESIRFSWQTNGEIKEETIRPDDSIYIKPHIPHSFSPVGEVPVKLLSLRIGAKTMGEPQRELSHIGKKHVRRILGEHMLWYREEKR
jgi:hypothetical protein